MVLIILCLQSCLCRCIPYRYKIGEKNSLDVSDELEVLVISSQKGKGMLFPKGGWELDESQKEAALRETMEEAGVRGIVEVRNLLNMLYKTSKKVNSNLF